MSETVKNIFFIFMLYSPVSMAITEPVPYPTKSRVIIYQKAKGNAAHLVINNPGERVWLLQSWIEDMYGKRYSGIHPSLSRLESNTSTRLLIYGPQDLWTEDRENLAWLNIRIIPEVFQTNESRLTIPIEYRLKLFLRPSSVELKLEPQIICVDNEKNISLKNTGKHYLTLSRMNNAKGMVISDNIISIPPGEIMNTTVPYTSGEYEIQYIDDNGLIQSKEVKCI
ncbi:fimbrial biogenesis chaperone [Escherichia coli]|uniref:fimbrial biogenesis chaperone n=1 Tax=Escherichia coli TaxID=562 RepID=UPI000B7D3C6F|nr:fimbria/pilus periplasmic chaperone [Escherichia coli]